LIKELLSEILHVLAALYVTKVGSVEIKFVAGIVHDLFFG
jgi:hypothetical protein